MPSFRESRDFLLPKTISGKIRRVQLRRLEHEGTPDDPFRGRAFAPSDFPELKADERTSG